MSYFWSEAEYSTLRTEPLFIPRRKAREKREEKQWLCLQSRIVLNIFGIILVSNVPKMFLTYTQFYIKESYFFPEPRDF